MRCFYTALNSDSKNLLAYSRLLVCGDEEASKKKANEYSRSQSFLFFFVSKACHQELVLRPRRLRGDRRVWG